MQQLLERVWTLLTPTPVHSGDMEEQMSRQSSHCCSAMSCPASRPPTHAPTPQVSTPKSNSQCSKLVNSSEPQPSPSPTPQSAPIWRVPAPVRARGQPGLEVRDQPHWPFAEQLPVFSGQRKEAAAATAAAHLL
ncbi:hypothetical protein MHYP_G00040300 [Metynnis hypsauchen]